MPICHGVDMQVGAVVPGASRQGASDWGKAALHDMVASTSLLLMLGLRKWLHKPMCGTLIAAETSQCLRLAGQLCSSKSNACPLFGADSSASYIRCGTSIRHSHSRQAYTDVMRNAPVDSHAAAVVLSGKAT